MEPLLLAPKVDVNTHTVKGSKTGNIGRKHKCIWNNYSVLTLCVLE
jgi:hypothetical protein